MNYAGFGKRFLAKIIDVGVFTPIYLLISYLVKINNGNLTLFIPLLFSISFILYNVLFTYYYGKTPGKIIMKLKVVKSDGNRVSIKNSIYREIFSILGVLLWVVEQFKQIGILREADFILAIFATLEYLWYFSNWKCKTIHDYIADTVVVNEGKTC